MYQTTLKFLLLVLLFAQCHAFSGEVKREDFPELQMVRLTLDNGMKVLLKQSPLDDETEVRLTAMGGYSSLPASQRASGEYAAQAAIRSGVGPYDFDKFSALLYDHGLEFNAEIQAFSRVIEAQGYPEEMETLFELVHLFFTKHQFNEIAFNKVKEKAKEQISHRARYSSRQFEDENYSLNTQNMPELRSLTVADVNRADFNTAKRFFEASFSDPAQFVCVVVGKFNMDTMVNLVSKSLSRIPQLSEKERYALAPTLPLNNKGVQIKAIKNLRSQSEAMTRITFPFTSEVEETNYLSPEKLALMLKICLKKTLTERFGKESIIINVSAEYPLYPYFHTSWINIQYISDPKYTDAMSKMILSEIKKLQEKGITSDEIKIFHRKFKKSRRLKECSNCYWAYQLTNFLLWNWNPQQLSVKLSPDMKREEMNHYLQSYISLDNYKIISAKP